MSGFREKVIMQTVVSVLVLVFAMTVSMFDNPLSMQVRIGLHRIFEGHTSAADLVDDLQRRSLGWFERDTEHIAPLPEVPIGNIINTEELTVLGGESKTPVPELSIHPEP
jgi:hypothetical protein